MNNSPKRNPIDLLRALKSVALSDIHRTRIREELSAYTDLHVLPQTRARVPTPLFSMLWIRSRSLYAGALALVLIVAGGTQASFASEKAVPGDILYPMKVVIAEPIALALTTSTEGRAELTARYASRRVDEAVTLSSTGKLDEKTADELAARFNEHVDALAKETGTLEANGDIAVSLAVRSDLEQKLTAKVNEISLTAVDASLSDSLERTMIAVSETPANIFAAQVREKSRSLATTRERLDSALALDLRAENGEEGISILAAMRQSDESDVSENTVSPVLFLTKQPEEVMLMSLTVSGTSTATTTATTTEGEQATSTAERDSGSPASRFFLPFRIR